MPKQTLGMICCLFGLAGCSSAAKPVVNSAVLKPVSEVAKPLPSPPPGAVLDRVPLANSTQLAPTDVMPSKGESEQQVDPSKLRQQN